MLGSASDLSGQHDILLWQLEISIENGPPELSYMLLQRLYKHDKYRHPSTVGGGGEELGLVYSKDNAVSPHSS